MCHVKQYNYVEDIIVPWLEKFNECNLVATTASTNLLKRGGCRLLSKDE